MASCRVGRFSAGNHSAWLPEILVVLFIYFGSSQLLLTLSDGFTINLGFVQIPVQMDIETSTLARSFVVSSLCHCCMPPMPRKRCVVH